MEKSCFAFFKVVVSIKEHLAFDWDKVRLMIICFFYFVKGKEKDSRRTYLSHDMIEEQMFR